MSETRFAEDATSHAKAAPAKPWRVAAAVIMAFLPPVILFVAAGRLDWSMAWAYVAVTYLSAIASRLLMRRIAADMVAERSRAFDFKNASGWDKLFLPLALILAPLLLNLVSGLDHRYGWSQIPFGLQLLGLAAMVIGGGVGMWAMAVNRFYSSVVRIQKDRGQVVVTNGPYRFVRHPGYASAVLSYLALPLMLGSWWGMIVALLVIISFIIRTDREDRLLQAELDGYREYASQVRYRLMKGIW